MYLETSGNNVLLIMLCCILISVLAVLAALAIGKGIDELACWYQRKEYSKYKKSSDEFIRAWEEMREGNGNQHIGA